MIFRPVENKLGLKTESRRGKAAVENIAIENDWSLLIDQTSAKLLRGYVPYGLCTNIKDLGRASCLAAKREHGPRILLAWVIAGNGGVNQRCGRALMILQHVSRE